MPKKLDHETRWYADLMRAVEDNHGLVRIAEDLAGPYYLMHFTGERVSNRSVEAWRARGYIHTIQDDLFTESQCLVVGYGEKK